MCFKRSLNFGLIKLPRTSLSRYKNALAYQRCSLKCLIVYPCTCNQNTKKSCSASKRALADYPQIPFMRIANSRRNHVIQITGRGRVHYLRAGIGKKGALNTGNAAFCAASISNIGWYHAKATDLRTNLFAS